jgi:hypothetical protein
MAAATSKARLGSRSGDDELGDLEEVVAIDMGPGGGGGLEGARVAPVVKRGEAVSRLRGAREEAKAAPVLGGANEVGLDGVGDGVGDALDEGEVIEDDDLGEAALEDGAVDVVERVDALGGVSEDVLHEGGDFTEPVLEDKVDVVAHLADRKNSDASESLLGLGEPEAEDLAALLAREETEFGALAADGDVEELLRLSSSRSSHASRECTPRTRSRGSGRAMMDRSSNRTTASILFERKTSSLLATDVGGGPPSDRLRSGADALHLDPLLPSMLFATTPVGALGPAAVFGRPWSADRQPGWSLRSRSPTSKPNEPRGPAVLTQTPPSRALRAADDRPKTDDE